MKKRPQLFSELADEEGNIPEFRDERQEAEPEIVADRKAVSGIVLQVMEELPEDQRDALWMVYGQKVTIQEMAASLGISENTIKSRLYQGRKKLLARREDFRKLGIELNIIPISVLVALAFREEVYAAVEIGAGAGTAAAVAKAAGKAGEAPVPAISQEGTASASAVAGEAAESAAATVTAAAGTATAGAGAAAAGMGAAAARASVGLAAKLGAIVGSMGIGAKIAAVGAGAVIATGGGVFVASQVFPEPEAYVAEADATAEEMGEDVADESQSSSENAGAENESPAAGQDDSAEVLYDNEDNRQAIALYRQALTEDSMFQPAAADVTRFAVFDLNGDGIYEMNVFVPGEYDAETYAYFCWYDGGEMHYEPLDPDSQQFLPEESIVISGMYQMGVWLTLYKFDGSSLTMTEQIGHEDPLVVENPEGMEEVEAVTSRAVRYNMVGVTEENLTTYLSGSGMSTGQAAEDGDVEEAAEETQAELEGGITSMELEGVQLEGGSSTLSVVNYPENKPSIPLYAAPDSNAERLAWVPIDTEVVFEQYFPDREYFQVSCRGITGYIESQYISPFEAQIWNPVHGTVVNCQESITVYSYPSADGEEIGRIPLGTDDILIIGDDNKDWEDFFHVSYDGLNGYVLASYIELYELLPPDYVEREAITVEQWRERWI